MSTECRLKNQTSIQSFISNLDTTNPYINSVYYDKIEPLLVNYQNVVSADLRQSRDMEALTEATVQVNQFINTRLVVDPNFKVLYPYLTARIQQIKLITPAEVDTVFDKSFLTVDTVKDHLDPKDPVIPRTFDEYYGPGAFNGSGMQSFCSLVPNIFAKYNNMLNDAFNDIKGFATQFTNILSSIQEFSSANLLESLKTQATNVIDQIVATVKSKIAAITGAFTGVTGFKENLNNVYSKMHREKQKIDQVMSDPSIENMKAAVEGAISFSASLFETLKLEEIQFLILRFCEMISGIENFFTDLTRPLEAIPNNFQQSFRYVQAAGTRGTARATAAGATRLTPEQKVEGRQQVDQIAPTVESGQGVTFGDEGTAVDGGIQVRSRAYKIKPITEEEVVVLNNELTFEKVTGGSQFIELLKGQSYSIDGQAVWTRVRPMEKVMLYRLSVRISKKITVNSAYRSLHAQSIINPSVKQSWHSSGQAFDVRMSSYSGMSFEEFKGHANSIGFSRVRPYNNLGFVHIDTGPPSAMW